MSKLFVKLLQFLERFWFPRATEEEFQDFCGKYNSDEELHSAFLANYVYMEDGIDYPRHHLTTFEIMSGDCDDFAFMFLHATKSEAKLLTVYSKDGPFHSVCLIMRHGKYFHAGNWPQFYGPFDTINDACKSIHPEFTRYVLRDRKLNPKE